MPAYGLCVLLRCVAMCDSVCANWVAREKEFVNTGKTPNCDTTNKITIFILVHRALCANLSQTRTVVV